MIQQMIFKNKTVLALTRKEPGGKHSFIARDEFNRSTYKKQDKREYKHYGPQSAVFNQALGIANQAVDQDNYREQVAALQTDPLNTIA